MKKFGLRMLKGMVRDLVEEAPERTPEELDHLARPRSQEARELMRFVPVLDKLPVDDVFQDLLPAARLILENVALECETDSEEGAQRRAQVRAWADELRRQLAA